MGGRWYFLLRPALRLGSLNASIGLRDAGLGRHLLMLTSEQLIRFNKVNVP